MSVYVDVCIRGEMPMRIALSRVPCVGEHIRFRDPSNWDTLFRVQVVRVEHCGVGCGDAEAVVDAEGYGQEVA